MYSSPLRYRFMLTAALACAATSVFAEGLGGFFPFGKQEAEAESAPQTTPPADPVMLGDPTLQQPASVEQEKAGWMVESPMAKVGWPEIKMPKMEFNPPWKSEPGEPNWFAKQATKARTAAHNAAEKTRTTWNTSLDKMKLALPGHADDSASQIASQDTKPGFWQRLTGQGETETQDEVPMIAQQPDAPLQR